MADVLDRVCRRRRIENPKEWALVTGDMRIVIPLDRTVASLAGKTDLVLVGKALLDHLGLSKDKRLGRSSDPNGKPKNSATVCHARNLEGCVASIFKRMSEVPAAHAALDFTAAYKVRLLNVCYHVDAHLCCNSVSPSIERCLCLSDGMNDPSRLTETTST